MTNICIRASKEFKKYFIPRNNLFYVTSDCANSIKIRHCARFFTHQNARLIRTGNSNFLRSGYVKKSLHLRKLSSEGFEIPELQGEQFFAFLKEKKHLFAFFYDPFCPHCRKADPEFLKAAQETSVPCVKIVSTENEWLCKILKIDSFPTFRYFTTSNSKVSWSTFSGNNVKSQFIAFLNSEVKSSGVSSSLNSVSKRNYSTQAKSEKNKLLHLTTSNISEQLENTSVLVLFYNATCNDCDSIIHVFIEATIKVDKKVGQFGICNAEQNTDITTKYAVTSFPTIKYFKNGKFLSDFQEEPKLDNVISYMSKMKNASKLTQHEKVSLWRGIEGADKIVHITNENLSECLKKHPSLLIFFYACWSRSCINLKQVIANAAKKLDEKFGKFAACDAEDNTDVADQLLVSHFPTFKYFRNGLYLTDYEGERSEENFLQFMQEPGKLGFVKVENRVKPSYSVLSLTGNIPPYWVDVLGAESLIFLTDYNFKSVLQHYKTILVMFYVPWCKACSVMKKEYGKAAFSLPLEWGAAIAACDAEENNFVADKFLVTKLPTLKIFRNGEYVENYLGRRKEQDILRFVKEVSMREISSKDSANNMRNYNAIVPYVGTMLMFWNEVEGGTDVALLNESNFQTFLDNHPTMLVMFYNPEGEHMETVRREFGLAAKNLTKEMGTLAAYEYKESDSVCKNYDISIHDLPTFKYFLSGRFQFNYTGVRSAESFLKFMNEYSQKEHVA